MKILILLSIFLPFYLSAQSPEEIPPVSPSFKQKKDKRKTIEEKKLELVRFDKIKKVLEEDQLLEEADKKVKKVTESGRKRISWNKKRYNIPDEQDFWDFMSELWLVKRANQLQWDFEKPDYGLDLAFKKFLEKMGYYEVSFKILVSNSPRLFHIGLPSKKSLIFVLSLPFLRTMDLSKTEICLLLFEDFKRIEAGFFLSKIRGPKLKKTLGSNFYKKSFDKKIIDQLLVRYDEVVFNKGFNFQEQFGVTQQMDLLLKNDLNTWSKYYNLLQKIDDLVKNNALFKDYNKVYPSPEQQMNWLKPKSKNI